ncbi:MAG: zeta toxin family protein [Chitinophagaceae bacterium]|nr:zeta toxin family protein [Chitinophagaceae bacterium]
MPELFILAGPNGAGKTTAAKTLLPSVFETDIFINADIIASELNPSNPESVAIKAGRIMIERIQTTLSQKKTFAIETTLATKMYFNLIKQAYQNGYDIILYFFYLPSSDMAKERVKLRVSKGGHSIPESIIERRYEAGIANFFEYIQIVNRWYLYENVRPEPELIARGEMPDTVIIYNFELWERLKKK